MISVTYKGTTKEATCDIIVEYSDGDVVQSGSSVSCTINWPKAKDLDKDVDFTDLFFIGDVLGEINTVSVSFNLFKKKNQFGSKTKTRSVTVEAESYQPSQPASYPADLW